LKERSSFEGELGSQLGDQVVDGRPGDLVYKPRHVPHTFWNNTDRPARLLEIITPYGLAMDFASVPVLTARHGLVAKIG
jgi:quercetin dioxygenase-like cupin family protein